MDEKENDDPRTYNSRLGEYILKVKGPNSKYFKRNGGKRNFGTFYISFVYNWKSFFFLFEESKFFFAYISSAFLGFFIDPLCFSFQLLNIIVNFMIIFNLNIFRMVQKLFRMLLGQLQKMQSNCF